MSNAAKSNGHSFAWLNATQFLGAINDNIFKVAMILFLTKSGDPASATNTRGFASAVFVVPFLLFLAFAGTVSDRFSKRKVVVAVKIIEVLVMVGGFIAFYFESTIMLYVLLFAMAAQSTFFAPAKYGIIPELVSRDKLSKANSLIEAFTYLAIIIGAASTPFLAHTVFGDRYSPIALICVVIAVIGLFTAKPICKTPPAGGQIKPSLFFIRDIWHTMGKVKKDKELLMAVLGGAYFLFFGGFLYVNLGPYGMENLGLDKIQSEYLFFAAAVGIGTGSFLAGKISGRNIEFGIVPIGAIGLTLSSLGLGLISESVPAAVVLVFTIGVSGGLFIIPMHALVQFKSPNEIRGQVLAASSWIGWIGVLISSLVVPILSKFLSAANLFIVLSLLMLALCIVTVKMLPDFFVRFIALTLTKICYRIKVHGAHNIPIEGPALLVSNHVSWIDALLIGVTQQRRIRFLMYRDMAEKARFKWFFKLMGVIPISSEDPPKKIVAALRSARAAMDEGYLVGIFAEGSITRNGLLQQFRPGFERIVKGTDYPVIPIYIGGAWGSIFSYYHGSLLASMPTKLPYPVDIHFGDPMSAQSTASEIRLQIQQLSCDYYDKKRNPSDTLQSNFIKTARKYWSGNCVSDVSGKKLTYGRTLIAAIALAEKIESIAPDEDIIGICIPPSVGGVLANIAVTLSGRTTVNLNYVVSPSARQFAIDQCGIKHVITAKPVLEKVEGLADLDGLIFLEDMAADLTSAKKFNLLLKAKFARKDSLPGSRKVTADSTATIIFSSGSTGVPKGIMLSHHNILSNSESLRTIIQISRKDDLCVVLPFFHSFGFTCGLWLPIITGVSANYVPVPIDGVAVANAVRENRSTILFAPPTFLLAYLRRAKPEDFASLRLTAVGAEKMKKRLADSYFDRFGITLYEGYGATELSPVVSLNVPDVDRGGLAQTGNKPGSVGHPISGVAVKIVHPDSGQLLQTGQSGLIMVKGPNVMTGYHNMPEKTAEVLKDGWYNTGDIGLLDEDGFLTITDRLSRFSKIGGEMVPHLGVEDVYLNALSSNEQLIAVTGIPDPKKGEELIVLYIPAAGDADKLHDIMSASDVPNMWKPRKTSYVQIDEMPLLGSGKLDLASIKQIALNSKDAKS